MTAEIVGRTAELAVIEKVIASAGDGLAALVIQGPPGIGKSTLWRATIGSAQDAGFHIFEACPAPAEQALSFGGLSDVFAGLSSEQMAGLPSPQRHALEVALLRADVGTGQTDQRAVSVAVARLLAELTEAGRPVLLAVDDEQWLDPGSAAVLSFAIRRLQHRPVAVVVSRRGLMSVPAPLGLDRAVEPERLELVVLGALSLGALHMVCRARLQRAFTRLELLRVSDMSAGNPFFALEIGRALLRSGAVITPGARLPVPETLTALVSQRITRLPRETRRALILLAAALDPTLAMLRLAAVADPIAALQPAVEDDVVTVVEDAVRFTHPMLAEAVLALEDEAARSHAHATLAGIAPSDDARARHRGQAVEGPDEEVASALEHAAAVARARGATIDASSLYERAAALTPPQLGERATDRARLAAECLFLDISETVQADSILERAVREAPPGTARASALSLRGIVRYYHGQIDEAIELAERALADAGDDPLIRARVLMRLAFLTMQVDLQRGAAAVQEAVALLEAMPAAVDPDLLANALLLRASADFGLVRALRRDDIVRAEALISANGRSWERENADGCAFGLARHTDMLDSAIAMTHRLIQEKSGPGGDDPFNLVQLAGLHCLRGDWEEARRVAELGLDGYAREGPELFPAWGLRGVAMVAAHQGRLTEAQRFATDGLELAVGSGNLVVEVMHRQILGFIALSLDRFAEADDQLSRAADTAALTGTLHPGRFKLDGDRVEAALALGHVERAQAIVKALEWAARDAPTPWVRAVSARGRAQVAAACGDLEGAVVALERAVAEHEGLPMPFELGRTLLVSGRVHRRRRSKRLADQALQEALRIFEELGAPLWAERARAELRRVGLRPRAPLELTETERRVAELAASGLSSRAIAEVAFLAPKTVGNVLGRVYQKLGISSRAQLGAAMALGSHPVRGEPTHK